MSDNFSAEDLNFEKVEAIPQADQDENVTSSVLTGDMAEEDRYESNTAQNATDMLSDFLSGGNEVIQEASPEEPLIAFGSAVPEVAEETAVESKPKMATETVTDYKPSQPHGDATEGCWMRNVDPRVLELIYWKDVKKTGIVFGSMMFVLLSLACCTILSVLAYLSLAGLAITLSFRLYKSVMQAVQKTTDGHPFKNLLNMDLELREDVVQGAADKIASNINNLSGELRRLFLVEDYVDSLKFGLLLWLMTYVGSWFNGMTLFILGVVAIFTLPKVYEVYQGPIDQNVNLVRAQLNNIMAQVSSKIPFPKKKVKAQ